MLVNLNDVLKPARENHYGVGLFNVCSLELAKGVLEAADTCICVPGSCTADIQELHLPVYHALCAMLEERFFE